ncbi:hypothetical protein BDW60DRAFT_44964 [Aspergillus nidulans var. acristatus]
MDRQIVATFASKNRYSPLVGQGLARSGKVWSGQTWSGSVWRSSRDLRRTSGEYVVIDGYGSGGGGRGGDGGGKAALYTPYSESRLESGIADAALQCVAEHPEPSRVTERSRQRLDGRGEWAAGRPGLPLEHISSISQAHLKHISSHRTHSEHIARTVIQCREWIGGAAAVGRCTGRCSGVFQYGDSIRSTVAAASRNSRLQQKTV